MPVQLALLFCYFVVLWLSAQFVINAVERLAHRFAFSRFFLSVLLLGPITSLPEMAVMVNSLYLRTPEVSLGNLIGGQIFLLFFIIPMVGLLTGKIRLPKLLQGNALILTLIMIGGPIVAVFDRHVTITEALILIFFYGGFLMLTYEEASFGTKLKSKVMNLKKAELLGFDIFKIVAGIFAVFFISNRIVVEITDIANTLQLSSFLVSLFLLSIGTNLPETSLAIIGILKNKRDVALGNFVGSAGMNSMLAGFLVLTSAVHVRLVNGITHVLPIFLLGLLVFWLFAKSGKTLTRKECLIILSFYIAFCVIEIGSQLIVRV